MSDRGSASIYGAIAGLVVVLIGLAVTAEASRLVHSAQARTAADFGALAGAMRAVAGEDAACARAERLAEENGAAVVSCLVDGLDVTLTVRVRGMEATALAGPIRSGSPAGRNRKHHPGGDDGNPSNAGRVTDNVSSYGRRSPHQVLGG